MQADENNWKFDKNKNLIMDCNSAILYESWIIENS